MTSGPIVKKTRRELDAKNWDKQMEEDAASGKLDFLFSEADQERKAGKLRDWSRAQTPL